MSQLRQLGAERQGQEIINWKLCILCQSDDQSKGHLVLHPRLDSYQKILDTVKERASLKDGNYVEMQKWLTDIKKETLCEEHAFWHRSCYLVATNKDHIQRARDRYEHALSTGSYPAKRRGQNRGSTDMDEPSPSGQSSPFTRSCTVPLDKDLCFFCQEDTDEQLFKVCTQNAGETLKSAVDKSQNPAFKTRLNTCISPTDAHAVDVRYHKSCWTKHVFHATRDQGDTKSSSKVHPLQNACLIELINLVDVQTQNQAYLSIDDIETAYTRMLGPDGMENHFPAFTRWWLKEKILTELPSVKSVLQKNRRKPAVLYSSCTQADLTEYLASKTVEYSKESPKLVIASAAGHTESNSQLDFEGNNHEEADTLLIHHAVLASRRNPSDAQLMFFSPDTDVLVLVVANYEILLKNTCVSMASGILEVKPIWKALGADRAKALPAFHAFTGADNTGRFSRIGKATWLNIYLKADDHVVKALQMLSQTSEVTEDLLSTLAEFVCTVYLPKGIQIDNIPELRWYLFCKHMAESDKLPPTLGALKQHVLRAHIQARVWGQADIAQQEFLDPLQNGYYKDEDGQLKPMTTESLPAPEAIIEMVRCQCKADCSSHRCSCNSVELPCTELCQCSTDCQNDEDSRDITFASDSDDDSEDDGDV